MNNVNKLPSTIETPAEEVDDRPDYVKKIESFDIDNITPENIQFMINTVQDYFLEHFPVKPELVSELPDRFCFMDEDEYVETATNGEYGEKGYVDFNIRKTQGCHTSVSFRFSSSDISKSSLMPQLNSLASFSIVS